MGRCSLMNLLGSSWGVWFSLLWLARGETVSSSSSSYFDAQLGEGLLSQQPYQDWLNERGSTYYDQSLFVPTSADPNQGVAFFWTIEEVKNEDDDDNDDDRRFDPLQSKIRLAVAAVAKGWLGFGISEAGGMKGADVVLFRTNDPNKIVDSYILDGREIFTDDCPNWKLVNSIVENVVDDETGWIILEVERFLDTQDPQDREIVDDSFVMAAATRLIAAWGDEEEVGYHGPNRANRAIKLFQPPPPQNEDDEDPATTTTTTTRSNNNNNNVPVAQGDGSFLVVQDDYSIPARETKYRSFCMTKDQILATLPNNGISLEEGASLTMIGVDPLIDERTTAYVHHFVMYGHKSTSCAYGNGFELQQMIYAWAPGNEPLVFPSNVGVNMLGLDDSIQSIELEIHYNNPLRLPNLLDSSGVRIHYSLEPREHQAGFLILGDPLVALGGTRIGNGLTEWSFDCPGSCSSFALGGTGESVTVIAESLHMHQTGVRMSNQVIRGNNNEIIHEGKVDYYDFEQQGSFLVPKDVPYTIQAGDSFRTKCYYQDGTEFGLSSQEEMCQVFIMYYPAKSLKLFGEETPWICGVWDFPICREDWDFATVNSEFDFGQYFGQEGAECPSAEGQEVVEEEEEEEEEDLAEEEEDEEEDEEEEEEQDEEGETSGASHLERLWVRYAVLLVSIVSIIC